MKKWLANGLIPIGLLIFILWVFEPVYYVNGIYDWFSLWLVIGIPFGLTKFLWIWIPKGYDIGGTVAIIIFGVLLSGIMGGVIAAYMIMKAVCILFIEPIKGIYRFVV